MDKSTMNSVKRVSLAVAGILVVVLLVGAGVWVVANQKPPPLNLAEQLQETYGRKLYSQNVEETFARAFFEDRRSGVFLDVGANDYLRDSNTLYLEEKLGWSGIAIDANADYMAGYVKHRPKTKFFTFFISDHSDDQKDFFVFNHDPRISAGDKALVLSYKGVEAAQVNERKIVTITLDALLDREKITKIDYMSLDIEDAEPQALKGFSIKRFSPELVCVEMHESVRDQVLSYFAQNGYQRIDQFLADDPVNMYFTNRPQAEWPASIRDSKFKK